MSEHDQAAPSRTKKLLSGLGILVVVGAGIAAEQSGLLAKQAGGVEDHLEEMSGVWAEQQAKITIKLAGSDKYLVVDIPNPIVGPMTFKASVLNYDSDNDNLSLALVPDPAANMNELTLRAAQATIGDNTNEPTMLRQIWDNDHKRFTLSMRLPGADNSQLAFVRKLTPADIRPPQAR